MCELGSKKRDKGQEAWQEEKKKRIADVQVGYINSCKGIGQSHDAAQEVIKNMAAIAEEKAKQAEENRLWETLRYQKAKQEELARKLEVKVDVEKMVAKDRRRAVECAADIERTHARNCASRAKSKSDEKRKDSEDGPQNYLHLNFNSQDIKRDFIQARLAGAPTDYKDTYFHSRFCVLKDRTNLKSAKGAHEDQNDAQTDAWDAAETHLKSVKLEKERKAEVEELWLKRKAERGQVAVAHLQKIASLEEELAVELEEEQQRKHQLQLIEDLSKVEHISTYKPDQRQHLGPKLSAKKDIEEDSAPKIEESGELNMTKDTSTVDPTAAGPMELVTTPPALVVKEIKREPDNVLEQSLIPALDAGKSSRHSTPEVNTKGAIDDERHDDGVDDKGTEIIVVRLDQPKLHGTSRKLSTPRQIVNGSEEMKGGAYSSPTTMNTTSQLRGNLMGHEGKTAVNEASPGASSISGSKLPGCTSKAQSIQAPTRTHKGIVLTPQSSSLPNLNSNNIRKGNKSPHRLDSPSRVAPNGIENQGTVDQIRELRNRSRGRPSEEVPDNRSVLLDIDRKVECCPPDGKKTTQRKHSGTWLSNVLEKLTWWKSQKELTFSGVSPTQDKAESEGLTCASGHPSRVSNKDIRKESTPKFPVKQVDSLSKSQPCNRTILFRSKLLEDANSPDQAEWQSDDEPGWYEAYTKDVFSPEELETLQLELYGIWTDDTISGSRNKAKLKRDKVKPGQQDIDSEVLLQQDHDPLCREDSLNKFKHVPPKFQTKEQAHDDFRCKNISKDPAAQLRCETFESDSEPRVKISNKLPERTLVEEVPLSKTPSIGSCERQVVADIGPERNNDLVNENGQHQSTSHLPERSNCPGSQPQVGVGGATSDIASDGKGPGELASARDVAEKLIQAWRTGQLGGTLSPMIDRIKQKSTQNSRKRRAQTDEESHRSPCAPKTGYKLGQRENINRPRQTSTAPIRKLRTSTPPCHSSVPQENNVAKRNSFSHCQEKSRNMRAPPKRIWSPSYSRRQQYPVQSKPEASSKSNSEMDMNARVEETAPAARSLDFILGSLSAQVKELDERLRSATSYAVRSSSADECSPTGEQKLPPDFREATSTVLGGKASRLKDQNKLGLKCSDGFGEHQDNKLVGTIEEEKLIGVRSPRAAPVKSPRIGGYRVSERDGDHVTSRMSAVSPRNLNPRSPPHCLTGFGSKSIDQGQSPISPMAICLKNLADLIQEMNRSTACEKKAPQTIRKSVSGNLPMYPDLGISNERNKSCDNKDIVGAKVSKELLSRNCAKTLQEVSGVPSRITLKSFAELCSVKTEPKVLHANTSLDAEEPCHEMVHRNSGISRRPVRQPEHPSLSSLDLEEAMSLDEMEEQLLLSGSVDFSPWSTEKLPDLFSSVAANLERSTNHNMEFDSMYWDGADVDCEGRLRPVYCHVKKESEWLLRGTKFKRKSKAYEKRRAGRGKGKQKSSPPKSFNPVALPPRHSTPRKHSSSPRRLLTAAILPEVSTTRIQPSSPLPGSLKFQKKELKLANDGSTKLNLTTRSLPAKFPGSVTAEEVQKWLCREAVGCAASLPDGPLSRESLASVRHQARFAGCKGPQVLESVAGQQGKLAQAAVRIPELRLKEASCRKKTIQPSLESRRRPASAGTVFKC